MSVSVGLATANQDDYASGMKLSRVQGRDSHRSESQDSLVHENSWLIRNLCITEIILLRIRLASCCQTKHPIDAKAPEKLRDGCLCA